MDVAGPSNFALAGLSSPPVDNLDYDAASCQGCKLAIDSDPLHGGVVVQFADSLWHTSCFRCATCGDQLSAQSTLVLLNDGSPVCSKCSYVCNVCKQTISDEAIMTGEDSYHASCFVCRTCNKRIEELVFAKTNAGIYCMDCHNERVARSRRRAEHKQSKSRTRKAKEGEDKSLQRPGSANQIHPSRSNGHLGTSTSNNTSYSDHSHSSTSHANHNGVPTPTRPQPPSRSDSKQTIPQDVDASFVSELGELNDAVVQSVPGPMSLPMPNGVAPLSMGSGLVLTPDDMGANGFGLGEPDSRPPNTNETNGAVRRQETQPTPSISALATEPKRSKSYDDGTRPLQSLFAPSDSATALAARKALNRNSNASLLSLDVPGGLDIPGRSTTKAERRRSMNPPPRLEPVNGDESRGRSASSGSDTSAYYSTGATDVGQGQGRTSPSTLEVNPLQQTSRSRSPSFSKARPNAILDASVSSSVPNDGIAPGAASSTSFPPRGQSLQNPRARSGEQANLPSRPTNGTASKPARPKMPPPEPSFSFEPASDDEDAGANGRRRKGSRAGEGPPPPPKDDSPSRPTTPNPPGSARSPNVALPALPSQAPSTPPAPNALAVAENDEQTPMQNRRAPPSSYTAAPSTLSPQFPSSSAPSQSASTLDLPAPALPPIRLSLHGSDFADILKSVAGSSPRVPMSQETSLRISTSPMMNGTRSDVPEDVAEEDLYDGDRWPRQSARTPSPSLPTGLGGESADREGVTPTQVASPPTMKESLDFPSISAPVSAVPPDASSATLTAPPTIAQGAARNRSGSVPNIAPSTQPQSQRSSNEEKSLPIPTPNANGPSTDLLRPSMARRNDSAPNVGAASNSSTELTARRLREAINDANSRGAASLKLDPAFAEALLRGLEATRESNTGLKNDLDQVKRASHQYIRGLTVAQEEYQKEVAHRKDLEAEVSRLRVQLAGQAARLVAVTAQDRTQAALDKLAMETTTKLQSLERDVAKLKVERDMALSELEEINTIKKSGGGAGNEAIANVSRALSSRLDYTKTQYRRELEPLVEKRERLMHDLAELREARAIFVEETTALNTRNEQLAELNAQIALQIQDAAAEGVSMGLPGLAPFARGQGNMFQQGSGHTSPQTETFPKSNGPNVTGAATVSSATRNKRAEHRDRGRHSPSLASSATLNTLIGSQESSDEFGAKMAKVQNITKVDSAEPVQRKGFKWFGPGGNRHATPSPVTPSTAASSPASEKPNGGPAERQQHGHAFTGHNQLRIARCDQCGDKLWGAALRCTSCNFTCHTRCGMAVKGPCRHTDSPDDQNSEPTPMPPSMFGRDLVEQVHSDDTGNGRTIPVIVEKCLEAVEAIGLDYEGIYRKTGGAGESKAITHLFERGRYDQIDLLDGDTVHDISSVTSVLKNYFRNLPNPLFTFEFHEAFIQSSMLKDPNDKIAMLQSLVRKLPVEHFSTVRALMLHLSRVERRKDVNLMNARNLGVVFGPTLMRSADPGQEFADMAGKAQTVEWMVNHAPTIFADPVPS